MNNSKKGLVNIVLIVLVILLTILVVYLALLKKSPNPANEPPVIDNDQTQNLPPDTIKDPPIIFLTNPILSADKKSISADDKVILVIDNDTIYNWIKTKSQLCDKYNIDSPLDRRMFCENKVSFKNQTRFTSIVVSPDKTKIGFTIESDTLTPDKVVGIFSRSTNTVSLLSSYYLGNEFISFSPKGINFVYKGGCFEGNCALFVKDSETLADKISLSDSVNIEARSRTAIFVKWLSDNEVEYKLDTEIKRAVF